MYCYVMTMYHLACDYFLLFSVCVSCSLDGIENVTIIKVTVCKLRSRAYMVVSLNVRKYMYVRQQTDECTTHETTTTLPTMHFIYK